MEAPGHTQIKTTQRYAHLTQETLQDAAEVAAAFIDQAAHGERSEGRIDRLTQWSAPRFDRTGGIADKA
jgi:hypothetical protein